MSARDHSLESLEEEVFFFFRSHRTPNSISPLSIVLPPSPCCHYTRERFTFKALHPFQGASPPPLPESHTTDSAGEVPGTSGTSRKLLNMVSDAVRVSVHICPSLFKQIKRGPQAAPPASGHWSVGEEGATVTSGKLLTIASIAISVSDHICPACENKFKQDPKMRQMHGLLQYCYKNKCDCTGPPIDGAGGAWRSIHRNS